MQQNYPLKTRYYKTIPGLLDEDERDTSAEAMRLRCLGISILQEYMSLPARPGLMPSSDGTLKGIVFTIPDYAYTGEDNPIRKVYEDLLLKLPAHTTFYILAQQNALNELKHWLSTHSLLDRTELHLVPERYQITIWAEDSFEIVRDKSDQRLHLVQAHSHRRTYDGNIGYQASKAFNWDQVKVPLFFEGGNMLVGDDFYLLGVDHAIATYNDWSGDLLASKTGISNTVAEQFRKYLDADRKLYFVGCPMQVPSKRERTFTLNNEEWTEILFHKNADGTMQPIFHIDMFITLAGRNAAGKYQLLVADTQAAVNMLGQPDMQLVIPDTFDEIAATLSNLGFEVIRNPLPLVYIDEPEDKVRKWYYASYNNALVEILASGEKTVWLPTYGHGNWQELKATDAENRRIWEELGFKVIQLEDFHPFAENSGATHCIKKYIRE